MSMFKKNSNFMKHWFAIEATPIILLVGGACVGAGWYLTRLARGSTVTWTKGNPHPYLSIEQDQGTKLLEMNQKFDKSWSRDKL